MKRLLLFLLGCAPTLFVSAQLIFCDFEDDDSRVEIIRDDQSGWDVLQASDQDLSPWSSGNVLCAAAEMPLPIRSRTMVTLRMAADDPGNHDLPELPFTFQHSFRTGDDDLLIIQVSYDGKTFVDIQDDPFSYIEDMEHQLTELNGKRGFQGEATVESCFQIASCPGPVEGSFWLRFVLETGHKDQAFEDWQIDWIRADFGDPGNWWGMNVVSQELEQLQISPNPASDVLRFESTESGLISVFATDGKLVLEEQIQQGPTQLNIQNLPSGTYQVILRNAEGILTSRSQLLKH